MALALGDLDADAVAGNPARDEQHVALEARDARAAVKAAVMCEDVCRTVHIARQLGEPKPIEPADVDALYERYQNAYGQPQQEKPGR